MENFGSNYRLCIAMFVVTKRKTERKFSIVHLVTLVQKSLNKPWPKMIRSDPAQLWLIQLDSQISARLECYEDRLREVTSGKVKCEIWQAESLILVNFFGSNRDILRARCNKQVNKYCKLKNRGVIFLLMFLLVKKWQGFEKGRKKEQSLQVRFFPLNCYLIRRIAEADVMKSFAGFIVTHASCLKHDTECVTDLD